MLNFEPLLVDTRTACEMLGIRRTLLFACLRDGKLERRKIGRKTVIPMESIRNFASRGAS